VPHFFPKIENHPVLDHLHPDIEVVLRAFLINNFRNQGSEHLWLLVKNQSGESMYVDPSSDKMKADSICPTMPEYKSYQETFKDIYELSSNMGGVDKYAWWNTDDGKKL
jgi:hypothetical protein